MTTSPAFGLIAASDSPGVHYSPVFYLLCGVVVLACFIVFFTVGRFLLRFLDRRRDGSA
ncbi:hypothetical protein ACIQGZ_09260 [Streptomyces sp. NPDC092296]|uniref:hypothetical protein n=1 Tax=Streptomyces sp. NPDC092296 TaxID=3366012 RepID=UPI0038172983